MASASNHPAFVCAGCDRQVASNTIAGDMLRAMTGYEHIDGADWCPQCAAALLTFARDRRHGEPEESSSAKAGMGLDVDRSLRLEIPASPDAISSARAAVRRFTERLRVGDPGAVALAVSEAITNAVMHAYRDTESGTIRITAEHPPDDGLVVTVQDRGQGLKPRSNSPGYGLGLPMVAQLAAALEIEPAPGGGTVVRMRFE